MVRRPDDARLLGLHAREGPNGTLYVVVTSDLVRRVAEHREGAVPGFTERYGVKRLVWYETHDSIEAAIRREKRLKKWPRAWKVALIETAGPVGRGHRMAWTARSTRAMTG